MLTLFTVPNCDNCEALKNFIKGRRLGGQIIELRYDPYSGHHETAVAVIAAMANYEIVQMAEESMPILVEETGVGKDKVITVFGTVNKIKTRLTGMTYKAPSKICEEGCTI